MFNFRVLCMTVIKLQTYGTETSHKKHEDVDVLNNKQMFTVKVRRLFVVLFVRV
jgi:hypothetical protein